MGGKIGLRDAIDYMATRHRDKKVPLGQVMDDACVCYRKLECDESRNCIVGAAVVIEIKHSEDVKKWKKDKFVWILEKLLESDADSELKDEWECQRKGMKKGGDPDIMHVFRLLSDISLDDFVSESLMYRAFS